MAMEMTSEAVSYLTPLLVSDQSLTTTPKMPARMGPIRGDTSMEATRVTLEFSSSPNSAMMLDSTSRRR